MEERILQSKTKEKKSDGLEKKLFKISWPIFIEFAMFMLLGSVDTFMLGRYSDDAVGAVGIVNQVMNMVILVFQIISTGTIIICAQYIGAKKSKDELFKVIGTAIAVNAVSGLVLSIGVVTFASPILHMMNLKGDLFRFGKTYLMIVGGFAVVQAIDSCLSGIIRSYGYTKVTMITSLFMNVINLFGNYTLIYGHFGAPRMGVAGSATATTVCRIIGAIILAIYLFRKVIKGFSIKYVFSLHKEEFKKILKVGLPSAGESIAYNSAKIVCSVFLTILGAVAVNTNSYINNIAMYIYIFSVAIGQGTAILVGQLVGEGRQDRAYTLCFASLKKAFMFSTIISIIIAVLGKYIFGIFTTNDEIIKLGCTILLIEIFLEPGRTFNIVVINSLRAAGDVRFPVYVGIVSMWVIGVGLSYVLAIPLGLGFPGMWFALALDEWLRGIIMSIRWKRGRWRSKALV